ncbi:hypothetical protein CKO40_06005 [Halochromatium glycolicum]|uniref:Uncharacterized protein n=1 Tax=Halochromatium glycolicum TaxID=85075 RepID=A0AAJ0U3G4_9GAMM|nr:hypothetical protein [Halochromatium glycolicum]
MNTKDESHHIQNYATKASYPQVKLDLDGRMTPLLLRPRFTLMIAARFYQSWEARNQAKVRQPSRSNTLGEE